MNTPNSNWPQIDIHLSTRYTIYSLQQFYNFDVNEQFRHIVAIESMFCTEGFQFVVNSANFTLFISYLYLQYMSKFSNISRLFSWKILTQYVSTIDFLIAFHCPDNPVLPVMTLRKNETSKLQQISQGISNLTVLDFRMT